MNACMAPHCAHIWALISNWATVEVTQKVTAKSVRHLPETQIGMQPTVSWSVVSAMFRITHITVQRFSLAEILLMVAINQSEAKREVRGNEKSVSNDCAFRADAA